jgi:peptide/nickel transport system permease protein
MVASRSSTLDPIRSSPNREDEKVITLVIRRIAQAVPSLVITSFVAFLLLSLAPGDPLVGRVDRSVLIAMSPAEKQQARADLGLEGSVFERYWHWLGGVVHGDFGFSIVSGRPAMTEIAERVGPTLSLLISAVLIATLVGIPIGVIAARRPNGVVDRVLTGAAVVLVSTPTFIFGLLLIYIFAIRLELLPAGGMGIAGEPGSFSQTLQHAVLPATVLGLANAAPLARFARSSMLDVLATDYIRTARSKGLGANAVLFRHGLRNGSLPLISLIAIIIPDLVAGAVITEQVFAWPGMGRLVVSSAQSGDASVMTSIVLVVALLVISINLLADVLYGVVDPRVRLS